MFVLVHVHAMETFIFFLVRDDSFSWVINGSEKKKVPQEMLFADFAQ